MRCGTPRSVSRGGAPGFVVIARAPLRMSVFGTGGAHGVTMARLSFVCSHLCVRGAVPVVSALVVRASTIIPVAVSVGFELPPLILPALPAQGIDVSLYPFAPRVNISCSYVKATLASGWGACIVAAFSCACCRLPALASRGGCAGGRTPVQFDWGARRLAACPVATEVVRAVDLVLVSVWGPVHSIFVSGQASRSAVALSSSIIRGLWGVPRSSGLWLGLALPCCCMGHERGSSVGLAAAAFVRFGFPPGGGFVRRYRTRLAPFVVVPDSPLSGQSRLPSLSQVVGDRWPEPFLTFGRCTVSPGILGLRWVVIGIGGRSCVR